jgi:hypothetical protein
VSDVVRGTTAKQVFRSPGRVDRHAPLPQLRQEIQRCGVCEGKGQLARDHWYLELQAFKTAGALVRTRNDLLAARDRLWNRLEGRCPRCGGFGKVIVVYDQHGRSVALLHYDDRGTSPDELAHLKKMNPSA